MLVPCLAKHQILGSEWCLPTKKLQFHGLPTLQPDRSPLPSLVGHTAQGHFDGRILFPGKYAQMQGGRGQAEAWNALQLCLYQRKGVSLCERRVANISTPAEKRLFAGVLCLQGAGTARCEPGASKLQGYLTYNKTHPL